MLLHSGFLWWRQTNQIRTQKVLNFLECNLLCAMLIVVGQNQLVNTPPETVPLDRTNGAPRPLKWCVVTASMVH